MYASNNKLRKEIVTSKPKSGIWGMKAPICKSLLRASKKLSGAGKTGDAMFVSFKASDNHIAAIDNAARYGTLWCLRANAARNVGSCV